jgi:hypothetical protein
MNYVAQARLFLLLSLSAAATISCGSSVKTLMPPDGGVAGGSGGGTGGATSGTGGSGDARDAGSSEENGSDAGVFVQPVLKGVTAIAVGPDFACALLTDTTVDCWGSISPSQGLPISDSQGPVSVAGLTGVTAIAAGRITDFACALLSDMTVKCWGDNTSGQLGNGTMTDSSTPVAVTGLSEVTDLTLGNNVACALTPIGTDCWGAGTQPGPTPFSSATASSVPIRESNLTTALTVLDVYEGSINPGDSTYDPDPCALFGDGTIQCDLFHENTNPAASLTGVTSFAADLGFATACALLSGGTVDCWGRVEDFGVPSQTEIINTPTTVLSNAKAITLCESGSLCAIMNDTSVECLGVNENGEQPGDPSNPGIDGTIAAPVIISGLTGVTAIGGGSEFVCVLMADTTVQCWGRETNDALGHLGTDRHTVVAPGSYCPTLQAACSSLSKKADIYSGNCLAAYNKDAPDENACADDLFVFGFSP